MSQSRKVGRADTAHQLWEHAVIAGVAARLPGDLGLASVAAAGEPQIPQEDALDAARIALALLADHGCGREASHTAVVQALADWCGERGIKPPALDAETVASDGDG